MIYFCFLMSVIVWMKNTSHYCKKITFCNVLCLFDCFPSLHLLYFVYVILRSLLTLFCKLYSLVHKKCSIFHVSLNDMLFFQKPWFYSAVKFIFVYLARPKLSMPTYPFLCACCFFNNCFYWCSFSSLLFWCLLTFDPPSLYIWSLNRYQRSYLSWF